MGRSDRPTARAVVVAAVLMVGVTSWLTWTCTWPDQPLSPEQQRAVAALDRCIAAEAYGLTVDAAPVLGFRPDDRVVLCLAGNVIQTYHRVGGVDFELCAPVDPDPPVWLLECWTVAWTDAMAYGDTVAVIAVARRADRPAGAAEDSFWLEPYVDALAVRVIASPPGGP